MQISPENFVENMKLMEHRYGAKNFETSKETSLLSFGTFYLTHVDSKYRRFYVKKTEDNSTIDPGEEALQNGHS